MTDPDPMPVPDFPGDPYSRPKPMPGNDRLAAYVRQNRGGLTTPRQRRRMTHKANRALVGAH